MRLVDSESRGLWEELWMPANVCTVWGGCVHLLTGSHGTRALRLLRGESACLAILMTSVSSLDPTAERWNQFLSVLLCSLHVCYRMSMPTLVHVYYTHTQILITLWFKIIKIRRRFSQMRRKAHLLKAAVTLKSVVMCVTSVFTTHRRDSLDDKSNHH